MRLWTIHPKYLDARGLTALWREGLLARHVLSGLTKGYRCHPQLDRFRAAGNPVSCIDRYLHAVHRESQGRGYRFDRTKIGRNTRCGNIRASKGQLLFEWEHFKKKLRARDPARLELLKEVTLPEANPVFDIVEGAKEEWEKQGD